MRTLLVAALTAIVASAATVVVMRGPRVASAQRESAFERVMRTRTLRCGYVISPPHLQKDPNTGALSGIAHDALEKMASHLGLKIDWAEQVGWATMLEGLSDGRYDMMGSAVWATSSRALRADALKPLDFA